MRGTTGGKGMPCIVQVKVSIMPAVQPSICSPLTYLLRTVQNFSPSSSPHPTTCTKTRAVTAVCPEGLTDWDVQQLSRWLQVSLGEEDPADWILSAKLPSAQNSSHAHLNIMINVFLLGGVVMPNPRPANQCRVSLAMQTLLESWACCMLKLCHPGIVQSC